MSAFGWLFLFVYGSFFDPFRAQSGFCFFGVFGNVGYLIFSSRGTFSFVYVGGQRRPFEYEVVVDEVIVEVVKAVVLVVVGIGSGRGCCGNGM